MTTRDPRVALYRDPIARLACKEAGLVSSCEAGDAVDAEIDGYRKELVVVTLAEFAQQRDQAYYERRLRQRWNLIYGRRSE